MGPTNKPSRVQGSDFRRWHYLRQTKTDKSPKRIIFVDTETERKKVEGTNNAYVHRLRLGYAVSHRLKNSISTSRQGFDFRSAADFWRFVECFTSRRETLWMFAHNAGFDFTILGLWDQLELPNYRLTSYVIDDPPTIIKLRINGCRVIILDTMNYWRCKLSELGESIGLPKREICFTRATEAELLWHCERDVEIIEKAVMSLVSSVAKHSLGTFALTAAGLSWNAYRRRFMRKPILIHGDLRAANMERLSYYGGRLDLFRIGKVDSTVFDLDINSLYPYVMMANKMPQRILRRLENPTVEQLKFELVNNDACAVIEVDSLENEYPYPNSSGLEMATGRFHTCLCGPELSRALVNGEVRRVYEANIYQMEYLFADFVEYFYHRKVRCINDGNNVGALLCKTILNSLYGKFAQQSHRWERVPELDGVVDYGYWYLGTAGNLDPNPCRSVAGCTYQRRGRGETDNSYPAIAAWITSHGREYMRRLRFIAGIRDVFYGDTDSLHVSEFGMMRLRQAKLLHPTRLGALKIKRCAKTATYRGQKDYSLGDLHVIAGLKDSARYCGQSIYRQPTFQGLRGLIRQKPDAKITVIDQQFQFHRESFRGSVDSDGWTSYRVRQLSRETEFFPGRPYIPPGVLMIVSGHS